MPFKSQAQKGWMFANHPLMAKQWAAETPDEEDLPKKKKKRSYDGLRTMLGGPTT